MQYLNQKYLASILNKNNAQRIIIYLAIFAGTFFLRSLFTSPMETGGDAIRKWLAVQYIETGSENLSYLAKDQHTSRWGVILPGIFLVKIFGSNISRYYFLPLFLYSTVFIQLLRIINAELGKYLALLFAVVLFLEPMMFRASSQFQPYVFGQFYLLCAIYFSIQYLNKKKHSLIVITSIFSFLTYAAKETYVYFIIGIIIFFVKKKQSKFVINFIVLFSFLLLIEIIFFNLLSNNPITLGRLEIILHSSHFTKRSMNMSDISYIQYFTQWLKIPIQNVILFLSSIAGAIYLHAKSTKIYKCTESVLINYCSLSYIILNTFLIISSDPIATAQGPRVKYLIVLMPFLIFTSFIIVAKIINFKQLKVVFISSLLLIFIFLTKPSYFKDSNRQYDKIYPFMWYSDSTLTKVIPLFKSTEKIAIENYWVGKLFKNEFKKNNIKYLLERRGKNDMIYLFYLPFHNSGKCTYLKLTNEIKIYTSKC